MADDTTKRVATIVAALSSFLAPFMGFSVTVAMPSIGSEFSMDAVLLGWIATAYSLVAAMFLIPFGKAGDIYGRKKVFTYGMAVYTVASLLCALAPSGNLLIAFRVLQGIGSTMIFGTGVAILTSVFPVQERGKALGMNVAATYLGLSLGPVLGGFLTGYFGWRSIFVANVPIGLVVIALVLWKLRPEWAEAKGETLDVVGSAVYAISLAAAMYGFSQLPAPLGIGLTLVGLLGLGLFIWWETSVDSPILNVNMFKRNAAFTFSNLAALINYCATTAVGFLLSLYLQYIKGMTPRDAGLILVAQPIVMAILSPVAGRLSDKIESRTIASTGMGLTAVGLVLLTFLNEQTTLGFIRFSLIVLGSGFGLFSSPNINAIMSSAERRFYGVASAVLGTMRLVGQTLGMGIITLVFALYIGQVEITPGIYPLFLTSVKTVFVISAALCFAGIFASLARGKRNLADRQSTGSV